MRKISATYIFPINHPPIKNGMVICDDKGKILDVFDTGGKIREEAGLEYYSGIIAPGFVNAHCHLELSHLHNKIERKTGIGGFIGKINQLRNEETERIAKTAQIADRKMWAAGIAAVGDICNSIATIDIKLASKIHYHTFVESFGFHPSRAERAFEYAKFVQTEFEENGLAAGIVPHSPYSVSEPLFLKIKDKAQKEKSIFSIHNQESKGETEFYKTGSGPIANHLKNNLGIDISHWQTTGKSSLASVLKYLPAQNQLLLVHNTFTQQEDVEEIKKHRKLENTYFVLCPNSNLYIENKLPLVSLFQKENLNICLGTDSLASNHQLSVLSEMITLQDNFPEIYLEDLIKWACLNGARALGLEHSHGSFEIGKTPGINLLAGVDYSTFKLTKESKVIRLA